MILWAAPSFLEAPLKSTREAQAVEVLKPQVQQPSKINQELMELVKQGTDEKQITKLIEQGGANEKLIFCYHIYKGLAMFITCHTIFINRLYLYIYADRCWLRIVLSRTIRFDHHNVGIGRCLP